VLSPFLVNLAFFKKKGPSRLRRGGGPPVKKKGLLIFSRLKVRVHWLIERTLSCSQLNISKYILHLFLFSCHQLVKNKLYSIINKKE
jgi:hypothetical protein